MASIQDIWDSSVNKEPAPLAVSSPSIQPSSIQNVWNTATKQTPLVTQSIKPIVTPTFGQSAKGLLSSLVTETGYGAGKIIDQILHAASRGGGGSSAPQVLGLLPKDTDNVFSDKIENFRVKFKEDLDRRVEEKRAANPMTNTFVGQTIGDIGGMLPTVALAGLKIPMTILSLSESFMNVEDSYNENIKRGLSKEESMKVAVPQLGADLLGTYITNKLGLLGKFSGGKTLFKSGKSTIGKIVSRVAEHIKDTGLEIGQEIWQQGLNNLATDKPFTTNMSDTAKRTIIPALFFSTVANISNNQIKKEIENINIKVEKGEPLTEEESAIYIVTGGQNPFIESDTAEEIKQKILTPETKTVFRGTHKEGTVESVYEPGRTLKITNDQQDLIRTLSNEGNVKAKELVEKYGDNRIPYNEADIVLRDAYKDQYDSIQYDNEHKPLKMGTEYYDLRTGKSYATNKTIADLHAMQNREEKYKEKVSTQKGREDAITKPVGEGEQKKSRLYQRLLSRLSDQEKSKLSGEEPTYNVAERKTQQEKAASFVIQNSDIAKEIILGDELPPEGLLKNDIATALEEKLLSEGNISEWHNIAFRQSLQSTRYGQEIGALRGTAVPENPAYWLNQIISNQMMSGERRGLFNIFYEKSTKTVASEKIKNNVKIMKGKLEKRQIKIAEAEKLLNSLLC